MERAGLKNIIDSTPITVFGQYGECYYTRGEEIQMWLYWHPEVKNYVIIDDRKDIMKDQMDHFVKVNSFRGFSDEDMEKAMLILDK